VKNSHRFLPSSVRSRSLLSLTLPFPPLKGSSSSGRVTFLSRFLSPYSILYSPYSGRASFSSPDTFYGSYFLFPSKLSAPPPPHLAFLPYCQSEDVNCSRSFLLLRLFFFSLSFRFLDPFSCFPFVFCVSCDGNSTPVRSHLPFFL